ncbi:MAG: acetoin dehydrogenase dihydrolipoyllysine-residue acetyltransferase subunit [Lautropia sp.]|nr:acetoin dehydrogenase dihydrolipoyllysine-residue acetyltransferase subunit [Lautropia sp.]
MTNEIIPIVMPKWGLSMKEGRLNDWLVSEGTRIEVGMPILDVETDKLANDVEATDAGLLRRIVVQAGEVRPVKALLGVMAEPTVTDEAIDAYVAAYQLPADESEGDEAGAQFQTQLVDGIPIRYQQLGEGDRTVLLIHGFGGDLNSWLFNLDELARDHRVIAVDLPGHGGSGIALPDAPDVPGLAAFMLRFLDEIGIERTSILAHSMGGAIGAQMALLAPQRIDKLALVSPCGLAAGINMAFIDGFIDAPSRRAMKPVLALLLVRPDQVTRAMVDDVLRYKRLDGVTVVLGALRDHVFPDGRQVALPVRKIDTARHPLMILWGEADQVIEPAQRTSAPTGAEVHLIEEAGHMCHMDQSSRVNALLSAFFSTG